MVILQQRIKQVIGDLMNMKNRKATKILTVILIASALLIAFASAGVKAQSTGSVYIYAGVGGTITEGGATLTGGTTYNYTSGTTVTFTATPGTGFKFLSWESVSASGATTSTTNPLALNVTTSSCALQAMFVPTTNYTVTSGTATGSSSFSVLTSIGGTTTPSTTTSFTIGQTATLTATPGTGFQCIGWVVATAAGSTIYNTATVNYNVTASGCAWQAYFVPTSSTQTIPEFSTAATAILTIARNSQLHSEQSSLLRSTKNKFLFLFFVLISQVQV